MFPKAHSRGFTLIELMIAVVIVALLAAVALPAYRDSVRKSRRSEGISALSALQQAQERERGRFTNYCSDLNTAPTVAACGLNTPTNTASGFYALEVSGVSGTGYTIVATAADSQAADTRCAKIAVQMDRGNLKYGSSPNATIDWADANRCWAR